jgi:cyclopropane-fatty-acyl-phospholipid synthase
MSRDAKLILTKLLDHAGVPQDDSEPWGLQVHNDAVWNRVLNQHNLGLAESYMDGWWDCDAIDEMFTRVLTSDLEGQIRPSPQLVLMAVRSMISNGQTMQRARKNAAHHYNIGNDLYSRMLDKRMIYSCGYWKDADNLDAAQEAKLDLICRKLGLEPGMALLDIGCGWGAFLEFATQRYGVRAVGISPAAEQVRIAQERCADLPVEIRQADYREVTGTFDRIVSIGMMEHVGPKNFNRFFKACDGLLASDGLMLHHTIGSNSSTKHGDAFMDKYIFPGGVIPSLTQISKSSESRFVVEDLQNLGPDYDRTLMAWNQNIEHVWDDLPGYDERFRRMWRYYLLSCAGGFRAQSLSLWQIVFRREGRFARYDAPR